MKKGSLVGLEKITWKEIKEQLPADFLAQGSDRDKTLAEVLFNGELVKDEDVFTKEQIEDDGKWEFKQKESETGPKKKFLQNQGQTGDGSVFEEFEYDIEEAGAESLLKALGKNPGEPLPKLPKLEKWKAILEKAMESSTAVKFDDGSKRGVLDLFDFFEKMLQERYSKKVQGSNSTLEEFHSRGGTFVLFKDLLDKSEELTEDQRKVLREALLKAVTGNSNTGSGFKLKLYKFDGAEFVDADSVLEKETVSKLSNANNIDEVEAALKDSHAAGYDAKNDLLLQQAQGEEGDFGFEDAYEKLTLERHGALSVKKILWVQKQPGNTKLSLLKVAVKFPLLADSNESRDLFFLKPGDAGAAGYIKTTDDAIKQIVGVKKLNQLLPEGLFGLFDEELQLGGGADLTTFQELSAIPFSETWKVRNFESESGNGFPAGSGSECGLRIPKTADLKLEGLLGLIFGGKLTGKLGFGKDIAAGDVTVFTRLETSTVGARLETSGSYEELGGDKRILELNANELWVAETKNVVSLHYVDSTNGEHPKEFRRVPLKTQDLREKTPGFLLGTWLKLRGATDSEETRNQYSVYRGEVTKETIQNGGAENIKPEESKLRLSELETLEFTIFFSGITESITVKDVTTEDTQDHVLSFNTGDTMATVAGMIHKKTQHHTDFLMQWTPNSAQDADGVSKLWRNPLDEQHKKEVPDTKKQMFVVGITVNSRGSFRIVDGDAKSDELKVYKHPFSGDVEGGSVQILESLKTGSKVTYGGEFTEHASKRVWVGLIEIQAASEDAEKPTFKWALDPGNRLKKILKVLVVSEDQEAEVGPMIEQLPYDPNMTFAALRNHLVRAASEDSQPDLWERVFKGRDLKSKLKGKIGDSVNLEILGVFEMKLQLPPRLAESHIEDAAAVVGEEVIAQPPASTDVKSEVRLPVHIKDFPDNSAPLVKPPVAEVRALTCDNPAILSLLGISARDLNQRYSNDPIDRFTCDLGELITDANESRWRFGCEIVICEKNPVARWFKLR